MTFNEAIAALYSAKINCGCEIFWAWGHVGVER